MAVTQLAAEIAQAEAERRRVAEIKARDATKRAEESEKQLQQLETFRTRLLRKQSKPKKRHGTGRHKRK